AYAEHKAEAMRREAAARGLDLAASYAYSDSVTDLPMLEAVGHPVAVNPDRELRRAAQERGWPIVDFSRPVAVRRSRRLPPVPAEVMAASIGGAVLAGVAYGVVRRQRTRAAA